MFIFYNTLQDCFTLPLALRECISQLLHLSESTALDRHTRLNLKKLMSMKQYPGKSHPRTDICGHDFYAHEQDKQRQVALCIMKLQIFAN